MQFAPIPSQILRLGLLLVTSLSLSACIFHKPRGGSGQATLASVSLQQLPDTDFDTVRVQVWDAALNQPQNDVQLKKGEGAISLALHPGDYRFQLDYSKGGQVILSSLACPDATKFTLVPGPNKIQIYVCDSTGSKFPPETIDCTDKSSLYGRRMLRLLTNAEYQNTVRDLIGGSDNWTSDFPIERADHGFRNIADNLQVTDVQASAYLRAASSIAASVVKNINKFTSCNFAGDEDSCTKSFINSFGAKVWRGPIASDEMDRLSALYLQARRGTTVADAQNILVQALFMSPRFLYRYELGDAVGDHFELNAWETAQALSYLYWGTLPDDRLNSLAASGDLLKPAIIAQESQRLLADARSRGAMGSFATAWLGADGVLNTNKNNGLYPQFTSDMRQKLLGETQNFFSYAMLDKNAEFGELFTAAYTVGDQSLADYYKGQTSANLVNLPVGQHQGLLSQGAVIATYSDSDATMPIKRGAFVLRQLFCQDLPPPPPNLDTTPPPRDSHATTRQRFSTHSANAACAICHKRIDGIGFGMEDMNAIGQFQSLDTGLPVDASGTLVGMDAGNQTFTGTAQLSSIIAKSRQAQLCFATQVQRFASGSIATGNAMCATNSLYDQFAKADFNLKNLFLAVSAQDGFRKRHN